MELLKSDESGILRAAQLLLEGKTVALPTETVYGLGANCFDLSAVTRVFEAKERPTFDPLIVHVSEELIANTKSDTWVEALNRLGLLDALSLTEKTRDQMEKLMRIFWPGPLTLVVPKLSKVPDLVTAGLPRVGIRMPKHEVARKIINAAGVPIAAPSANRFGRISPTQASHVVQELDGRIAAVVDGGPCAVGVESTVLLMDPLTLLRPGAISAHQISETLNEIIHPPGSSRGLPQGLSPGTLASHYAPRKPLVLLPMGFFETGKSGKELFALAETQLKKKNADPKGAVGLLLWDGRQVEKMNTAIEKAGLSPAVRIEILSRQGDVEEAARDLFRAMRTLDDDSRIQWILADSCPHPTGLGHAIHDRLTRAAY
ncbi:MAG: L-threonylcarbamoyladenylate synthase [Bdellovibrionales bacterium]|nr:L-threonylcarbamoyladenylate synthase [Bdellovibrionales bacterium]